MLGWRARVRSSRMTNWTVLDARIPSLSSFLPLRSNPFMPGSRINALIPRVFFTSGSVRTMATMNTSASWPVVMKFFDPFRTYSFAVLDGGARQRRRVAARVGLAQRICANTARPSPVLGRYFCLSSSLAEVDMIGPGAKRVVYRHRHTSRRARAVDFFEGEHQTKIPEAGATVLLGNQHAHETRTRRAFFTISAGNLPSLLTAGRQPARFRCRQTDRAVC